MRVKDLRCFLVTVFILAFLLYPFDVYAADPVETILDNRTAFRWSRDYLAWVVHYPEDIVGPWVMATTEGAGDPTGKIADSFRKSLRMGESTPVLLSLHCYRDKVVELNPLSDRLFLRNSEGEELSATSYESIFDTPMTGLVQGLVFFPPVEGPFEIVMETDRGRELVFTFLEDRKNILREELTKKLERKYDAEAVVKTHKRELLLEKTRKEAVSDARKKWDEERQVLMKRMEKISAQKDMLRNRLDKSLAELARKNRPVIEKVESGIPGIEKADKKEKVKNPPGFGHDQVIDLFMLAWQKGDMEEMAGFLSPAFQKELVNSDGLKKYLKDKALPDQLPSDAKLKAEEGADRAKIIFAQKLLIVRTLRSADIEISNLQNGWYITALE